MSLTPAEILAHDALSAELTSADGHPRLTWHQHQEAFLADPPPQLDVGMFVAALDSATCGTVVGVSTLPSDLCCRVGRVGRATCTPPPTETFYTVSFPDLGGKCVYRLPWLRHWPTRREPPPAEAPSNASPNVSP